TLFVWGSRDAITAKPRRLHPNDILIPANHSAPVLAATEVAAAVLPFLTTGELQTQESNATRHRTVGKGQAQGRIPITPFLSLRTSPPHAVWHIWRKAIYKRKIHLSRSKKEVRLISRLRTNGNKKFNRTGEARGRAKEYHLPGPRQKKV